MAVLLGLLGCRLPRRPSLFLRSADRLPARCRDRRPLAIWLGGLGFLGRCWCFARATTAALRYIERRRHVGSVSYQAGDHFLDFAKLELKLVVAAQRVDHLVGGHRNWHDWGL